MDNSATSFPKPAAVTEAMARFASECGASAGRGAYAEAVACGEIIATCRARVAELIGASASEEIVFTLNCSEALAIGIRGVLNTAEDAHAVGTVMEHNSVLRPFSALRAQRGLEVTYVQADPSTSLVDPDDLRKAIRPNTKLVAVVHASNVTGSLQPVGDVAAIAREAGVPCIVDAAQSIGHVPIDVGDWGAEMVAFPGHKGALGPLGTGVLYVRSGFETQLATMKEGGTGTISEQPVQPETMPDKFEIGSHNAVGIAGLSEGVKFLLDTGVDALRAHDCELSQRFMDAVDGVTGLTVYGPRDMADRTGVFSVNIAAMGPQDLAAALEASYGICTRPGIHCAPLAHRAIGTFPAGTCRLSFGAFTTIEHIDRAADALKQLASART